MKNIILLTVLVTSFSLQCFADDDETIKDIIRNRVELNTGMIVTNIELSSPENPISFLESQWENLVSPDKATHEVHIETESGAILNCLSVTHISENRTKLYGCKIRSKYNYFL